MARARFKATPKGSKFEIRLHCDRKEAYAVSLYSYKRNQDLKEVVVHDAGYLGMYEGVTLGQQQFIDNLVNMARTAPFRVPCSVSAIKQWRKR